MPDCWWRFVHDDAWGDKNMAYDHNEAVMIAKLAYVPATSLAVESMRDFNAPTDVNKSEVFAQHTFDI